MTPAEKLEAAIELLERMSADGSDGSWYADWLIGGPALGWRAGVFNGVERIALCQERDAHLIATLHRTIDAQLHMLGDALECDRPWKLGQIGYYNREIELAEAILGGDQ